MWRTLWTKNGTIISMEIVTLLWPSVHSYLTDMEFDMPSLTDNFQSVQGIGTYNAYSLISCFFGRYSNMQWYRYMNIAYWLFVCLMMLNATFSKISVISLRSILLVEETGGSAENHRTVASHWQTLSHNVVHLVLIEIRTHSISCDRHWLHK
jgi:hypothetical protein